MSWSFSVRAPVWQSTAVTTPGLSPVTAKAGWATVAVPATVAHPAARNPARARRLRKRARAGPVHPGYPAGRARFPRGPGLCTHGSRRQARPVHPRFPQAGRACAPTAPAGRPGLCTHGSRRQAGPVHPRLPQAGRACAPTAPAGRPGLCTHGSRRQAGPVHPRLPQAGRACAPTAPAGRPGLCTHGSRRQAGPVHPRLPQAGRACAPTAPAGRPGLCTPVCRSPAAAGSATRYPHQRVIHSPAPRDLAFAPHCPRAGHPWAGGDWKVAGPESGEPESGRTGKRPDRTGARAATRARQAGQRPGGTGGRAGAGGCLGDRGQPPALTAASGVCGGGLTWGLARDLARGGWNRRRWPQPGAAGVPEKGSIGRGLMGSGLVGRGRSQGGRSKGVDGQGGTGLSSRRGRWRPACRWWRSLT
ncbi:hypothetical protein BJY16_008497 [Actinoplanes octamycinicus]|uniref:Uncharacterized protein n=1 Tax=Actinoplanes octamycinicus TaxID=135948 RepID=A0A7W7MCE6_9ACTN|nr:hypothetical protein [Actinoplanes octamycinicus]